MDAGSGFDPEYTGPDDSCIDPALKGGVGGTGLTDDPTHLPVGDVESLLLDDPVLEGLIGEALKLDVSPLPTQADSSSIAASEHPQLEAAIAHYSGTWFEGDLENPEWCNLLLEDGALRADLIDLGGAEQDVETAGSELALDPHVRNAALGAFARAQDLGLPATDTQVAVPATGHGGRVGHAAGLETTPLRAAKEGTLLSLFGWRAAAALVLVAVGVAMVAFGGILHDDITGDGTSAAAGMKLDFVAQYATESGAPFASRQAFVPVGESFRPVDGQVVVFGLGEASHVVVREGDALAVASGKTVDAGLMKAALADLAKAGRSDERSAVLRLEAGEAQLDSTGGNPVMLAVGKDVLLVLWRGQCHVAVDPGADEAGAAIAITQGTRVLVYRSGTRAAKSFELVGPKRVLLGKDGPKAFGAPAASLFRDLELFGGRLDEGRKAERAVRVAATLWRSVDRVAKRRDGRFVLTAGKAQTLAFRPQAGLLSARAFEVHLRAPKGTKVSLRHAAGSGAAQVAFAKGVLERATWDREPGISPLRLSLGADWARVETNGDLELVIELPKSTGEKKQRTATFEGAAFVVGGADTVPGSGK